MIYCTLSLLAVEAALRGDETPPRGESISVNHAPPLPATPRPPIPHHAPSSSPSNGRHGSPATNHKYMPQPISRTSSRDRDIAAPPLPNRVGGMRPPTTKDSQVPPPPPPNRPSSPNRSAREGPPLPQRGSFRGGRPSPTASRDGPRKPTSPPVPPQGSNRGGGGGRGNPPVPPPGGGGGRGNPPVPPAGGRGNPPVPPAGGGGGRGNPPVPPAGGGRGRPNNKPSLPGKPKPALLAKPSQKKPPSSSTRGDSTSPSISIPSPDQLTSREMVDTFLREAPSIISAVQSGSGSSIPRVLDDLRTLGEAITEKAKGTSVQFRIKMTKFRSCLSTLKTYSNSTWYNSVEQIVEELEKLVTYLEIVSGHLIE